MPILRKRHKEYIVKHLAMFERICDIREQVKEEFGVDVDKRHISYYNPETSNGRNKLADKWCFLFNETRDKFLEGAIEVPVSHKVYRLKELQKMYHRQVARGEDAEARETLITAAREMGGAYDSNGAIVAALGDNASVNFYTQVNQKILEQNGVKVEKTSN